jgi:hypothetical protein
LCHAFLLRGAVWVFLFVEWGKTNRRMREGKREKRRKNMEMVKKSAI